MGNWLLGVLSVRFSFTFSYLSGSTILRRMLWLYYVHSTFALCNSQSLCFFINFLTPLFNFFLSLHLSVAFRQFVLRSLDRWRLQIWLSFFCFLLIVNFKGKVDLLNETWMSSSPRQPQNAFLELLTSKTQWKGIFTLKSIHHYRPLLHGSVDIYLFRCSDV